jgi:hypothetical protein
MDNQVLKLMNTLDISEQEAKEVLAYDRAIDQGKPTPYDFTPEQEKSTRKFRQAERKRTAYNFTKRERKPNATKGGLIQEFYEFLTEKSGFSTENVEITNKERQIAFQIGEDKFELTLVQKRRPKK